MSADIFEPPARSDRDGDEFQDFLVSDLWNETSPRRVEKFVERQSKIWYEPANFFDEALHRDSLIGTELPTAWIQYVADASLRSNIALEYKFRDHFDAVVQSSADIQPSVIHKFTNLSRLHSWMWSFLVLLALIWGIVTGASLFAGFGVTPATALFGFLATLALALTLFLLGTRTPYNERDGRTPSR
jgi:hypothetical protein